MEALIQGTQEQMWDIRDVRYLLKGPGEHPALTATGS